MDFSFIILEKSDCIENINKEDCDGDKSDGSDASDDFVIISPHKWNPLMTESVLVVPTKDFFNEIVNNTNMEEACHQLDVDFPRQTYTLNNQILVSVSSVLKMTKSESEKANKLFDEM